MDALDGLHLLQFDVLSQASDIPNDSQFYRHFLQALMQVVQHEDGFSRVRQLLAELGVASGIRLIRREMGGVKVNPNNTDIPFQYQPPAGHSVACGDQGEHPTRNGAIDIPDELLNS